MSDQMPGGPGVLTAAGEVTAIAAKYAAEAEAGRLLRPEVVDAMVAAGFARHFVPTRWGGVAGTFTELAAATAAVGEGCASAAWCASVAAGSSRMGAYLPVAGQAELWTSGPDTFVVGALSPSGRAERRGADWLLSGEWQFASGADFSDWALVCALVPDGDQRSAWFFAVPRESYRVLDTWFNAGMRATGSNTIALDDVLVPAHRGFPRDQMLAGTGTDSPARCHTAPLRLISGLLFAAPALGAARGALKLWSDWISAKRDQTGRPARERTTIQLTLARSAGEIDAAQLLLERAADIGDQHSLDQLRLTRNARDFALSTELLVAAVDRLFSAGGTSVQSESNPIQRAWRDVHCIAGHIALQFEPTGSEFARELLKSG